jgi:membrane protein
MHKPLGGAPSLRRLADQVVAALLRVQIFDRSMTIAAQAFTSIFPVLIMLGGLLGLRHSAALADLAGLPAPSRQLFQDALSDRRLGTFGLAGGLIVLISATSLARALARAYGAIWERDRLPTGLAGLWRWLATVLLLAIVVAGTRIAGGLTGSLPAPLPYLSSTSLRLLADCAITIVAPWLLLGGTVPVRRLAPGGILFGLVMLGVRPVGAIYLPRALRLSEDRYGTIGLAFTYIGWLYVLAFVVLATAVLGQVLSLAHTG